MHVNNSRCLCPRMVHTTVLFIVCWCRNLASMMNICFFVTGQSLLPAPLRLKAHLPPARQPLSQWAPPVHREPSPSRVLSRFPHQHLPRPAKATGKGWILGASSHVRWSSRPLALASVFRRATVSELLTIAQGNYGQLWFLYMIELALWL